MINTAERPQCVCKTKYKTKNRGYRDIRNVKIYLLNLPSERLITVTTVTKATNKKKPRKSRREVESKYCDNEPLAKKPGEQKNSSGLI